MVAVEKNQGTIRDRERYIILKVFQIRGYKHNIMDI